MDAIGIYFPYLRLKPLMLVFIPAGHIDHNYLLPSRTGFTGSCRIERCQSQLMTFRKLAKPAPVASRAGFDG